MNRCRRRIQKARRRRGRITDAAAHAREVAARVMRKNFNPNRMPLWLRPQATWTDYCPEHAPTGVPMVHAAVRTSTGKLGSVLLTRDEYDVLVNK